MSTNRLRKVQIERMMREGDKNIFKEIMHDAQSNLRNFEEIYLRDQNKCGHLMPSLFKQIADRASVSDDQFIEFYKTINNNKLDKDFSMFNSVMSGWYKLDDRQKRLKDFMIDRYIESNEQCDNLKTMLLKRIASYNFYSKQETLDDFNKIIKLNGQIDHLHEGNSALHTAAKFGKKTFLIDALIKNGADYKVKNKDGKNAMEIALDKNNKRNNEYFLKLTGLSRDDVLKESVNQDMSISELTDEMLVAYDNKNFTKFSALVDAGANVDVNMTETTGVTLISRMMKRKNNEKFLQKIIDSGADINAVDNYGWTPLHQAVSDKRDTYVDILLNAGVDCDRKDISGKKPINFAIRSSRLNVFNKLLPKTELKFRDRDGNTLIHEGCGFQTDPEILEALSLHLDVYQKDASGKTPMQICKENGNEQGVAFFENIHLQDAVKSLPSKKLKNSKRL